jgi:hypothetical protein
VTMPFDHPALRWLMQTYEKTEGYALLFNGALPEIMGESPYLNSRDGGIAYALDKNGKVIAIFLYAEGVEEFAQYQAQLPADLSFTNVRADVITAMQQKPALSAEAGGEGIFAIPCSFDRFEEGAFYIRFEYWPQNAGIRMVTMGLI